MGEDSVGVDLHIMGEIEPRPGTIDAQVLELFGLADSSLTWTKKQSKLRGRGIGDPAMAIPRTTRPTP